MNINLQMHILREPQASSVISRHPWGAVLKPCLAVSLGAGRTLQGWPPGHSELQAPPARQKLGSRLPRVKWWVLDPLLPTACRSSPVPQEGSVCSGVRGVLAPHPLTAGHPEPVTGSKLQRLYPLLFFSPKFKLLILYWGIAN